MTGLVCGNCQRPIADHLRASCPHAFPCCPGKCPAERTLQHQTRVMDAALLGLAAALIGEFARLVRTARRES